MTFLFFLIERINEIKLSKSDRDYIDSLSPRPLALIICSQTYNGKARFVNELLNDPLLPESPTVKKEDIVRMMRIKVNIHQFNHDSISKISEFIQMQIKLFFFSFSLSFHAVSIM